MDQHIIVEKPNERRIYMNQQHFETIFGRKTTEEKKSWDSNKYFKNFPNYALTFIFSIVPILKWLPKYNWKKDLSGDIIGGLTVGIMHVPQGMAYASLASLPPVIGMYSSFFASTIYMFFGTSRHVSIGVFAVASLMVGSVRLRLVPDPEVIMKEMNGTTTEVTETIKGPIDFGYEVTPLMLTSAITMAVGLIQLLMAVLRLSFLTTYLSDVLVSGFTTGAACHVLVAQLNKVIGVKLPRHSGPGMLFLMIRDLVASFPHTNYVSLSLSLFAIIFLYLGKEFVNPWVKKRSRVPVPLELILVLIATVFSVVMNLKKDYGVKIVDHIPQGVPQPSIPRFDLFPHILSDALGIAIISYMFVISMAKLFANKRKYKIDPQQEFFAVGMMSSLSSFFPVFPTGASLSRSSVCEQSGANTQLYTVFSSSLLLIVIIWLGPLLQPLPMCILASIVIISLKSLFMQCSELTDLWRISKFDFMIWIVSCIATLANDVTTGLLISVAFALISIILREQWPKINLLGKAADYDIYKPKKFYEKLSAIPNNVRVVRFEGPLHFVNVAPFIKTLQDALQVYDSIQQTHSEKKDCADCTLSQNKKTISNVVRVIVVDCSAISYIDKMGIDAIKEIHSTAAKVGVNIYYAEASESILNVLERIGFFEIIPKSVFFPTVHTAIQAIP